MPLTTYTAGQVLTAASLNANFTFAAANGKIAQIVSTNLPTTFSSSAVAFTDITGLSVSITPTLATSKILVLVNFNAVLSGDIAGQYRLMRDSTAINIGTTAGSRTADTMYHYIGTSQYMAGTFSTNFLDSPSTTSATTYKMQGFVNSGTFYINRDVGDSNAATTGRTASNITVMEVLV